MTQNRVDSVHEQSEQLVTLYQYDGRNLVTKVVRSSGDEELYTYDGNGNMLTKTDADGYVTEYTYNSLDLVSGINYNDAKEVSYQYNKVGELVKMDDWLGTTTFEVDLLGQLKKMTDHKGQVVSYEYDAVGNQTSVTYPDETTVTKTYDNTYNLTKVTDAENQNYLYQYDDAGRVTKLTYPNGWVEDYTYDNEGNLLKTVDTDPFHNNKKSTKYEYRYDAEGNLVSEYKRDTTAGNKALTTTYAYDALNRLVSAHEEGVGVNTTRTYQYDTLGNMIREEQDGCIEYRYNGYSLDESTKCGTIPNSIGTAYWEYTYDGRGNLISNDKYTRTTSGMDWQNVETYVYDETNRLVQGTNELGEVSIYTYNGLGVRVGRELIMKDNTHGYTDFHSQTPSVETGIDKPEVVKESYVIDYTSATFNTLVMDEVGGFNYRWTYGLDKLNVKITSEGTNWWGQHVTTDILKDYLHQDRMGSTTNLTDTFGRVVGRADYNEWGEMTYREALTITSSYRRIYPQSNYTGHDWDDVLGMYYAKARFYSADDKRFVAMDPVKGQIIDPLSLVSYLYCVDNPLRWVDPLGMVMVDRNTTETFLSGGAQSTTQNPLPSELYEINSINLQNAINRYANDNRPFFQEPIGLSIGNNTTMPPKLYQPKLYCPGAEYTTVKEKVIKSLTDLLYYQEHYSENPEFCHMRADEIRDYLRDWMHNDVSAQVYMIEYPGTESVFWEIIQEDSTTTAENTRDTIAAVQKIRYDNFVGSASDMGTDIMVLVAGGITAIKSIPLLQKIASALTPQIAIAAGEAGAAVGLTVDEISNMIAQVTAHRSGHIMALHHAWDLIGVSTWETAKPIITQILLTGQTYIHPDSGNTMFWANYGGQVVEVSTRVVNGVLTIVNAWVKTR